MLKRGSQGSEVIRWQKFLLSQGFSTSLDGIFGANTEKITKEWQKRVGLTPDGIVGDASWAKTGSTPPQSTTPPKPSFSNPTEARVIQMFGNFPYSVNNDWTIKITNDWAAKNVTKVQIPQLIGVYGAPADGKIYFHKLAVRQLQAAFQEIEDKGLKNRIISWGGSFYPRMIRGSKTKRSNHSWGSAFDINAPENWLGSQPAKLGQKGCLLELVPIFNKHGFFWGGHYSSRLDGMHFEIAVITTPQIFSLSTPAATSHIPLNDPTDQINVENTPVNVEDSAPTTSEASNNQVAESSGAVNSEHTKVSVKDGDLEFESETPQVPTETKEAQAPAGVGVMSKARNWAIGLGVGLPSASGAIASLKDLFAGGGMNAPAIFAAAKETFFFIAPYLVYLTIAFVAFWMVKELFKQISFLLQMWINSQTDRHDIEIVKDEPVKREKFLKIF